MLDYSRSFDSAKLEPFRGESRVKAILVSWKCAPPGVAQAGAKHSQIRLTNYCLHLKVMGNKRSTLSTIHLPPLSTLSHFCMNSGTRSSPISIDDSEEEVFNELCDKPLDTTPPARSSLKSTNQQPYAFQQHMAFHNARPNSGYPPTTMDEVFGCESARFQGLKPRSLLSAFSSNYSSKA